MTKHKIKTLPCYFEDVLAGDKPFEIRLNDRDYQKGDIVVLQEYKMLTHSIGGYTGREITVQITCVCSYEQKEGFVVFGFKVIEDGK